MGEARKRGTRDERIGQAVERRHAEDAARNLARQEARRIEEECIRNLPPEIRKEIIMGQSSSIHRAAMLMAMTSASIMALPITTRDDYYKSRRK